MNELIEQRLAEIGITRDVLKTPSPDNANLSLGFRFRWQGWIMMVRQCGDGCRDLNMIEPYPAITTFIQENAS